MAASALAQPCAFGSHTIYFTSATNTRVLSISTTSKPSKLKISIVPIGGVHRPTDRQLVSNAIRRYKKIYIFVLRQSHYSHNVKTTKMHSRAVRSQSAGSGTLMPTVQKCYYFFLEWFENPQFELRNIFSISSLR